MFVETENGLKWISERDTTSLQDPVRLAGEWLAWAVEAYLYDENSGVWMKPEFLAYAVENHDKLRTGSGNYSQQHQEFDQDELSRAYEDMSHAPVVTGETQKNIAVRYPEHARKAPWVDTDPHADEPKEDD